VKKPFSATILKRAFFLETLRRPSTSSGSLYGKLEMARNSVVSSFSPGAPPGFITRHTDQSGGPSERMFIRAEVPSIEYRITIS
jgi:hypothetical protein